MSTASTQTGLAGEKPEADAALAAPDLAHDVAALGRLLDGRWSCRSFLPEPVPRDVIEQMLDLARRSPSWCNTQPWQVIVTEGVGTERYRAALAARAAGAVPTPDFAFP
jgi:nitroreductase